MEEEGEVSETKGSGLQEEKEMQAEGIPSKNPTSSLVQSSGASRKKKKKKGKKSDSSAAPNHDTSDRKSTPTHTTSLEPQSTKSSFEEELEWCIAQLELGMLRPEAGKSQKQQNQRSIQTLRGSRTPLPKKRQLMRNLFGDYRSKMKSQPLPENYTSKGSVKVEAAKPEVLETVGTYYRKSLKSSLHASVSDSDSTFKFNFEV